MKKLMFPLFLGLLLSACGNETPAEESSQSAAQEESATLPSDLTQCFLFTEERDPVVVEGDTVQRMIDSIKLRLLVKGTSVEGVLDFLPAEQDARRGAFTGNMLGGGNIEAFYEYTQEGMTERVGLIIRIGDDQAEVLLTELEENGTTVSSHALEAPRQVARVDCW